jgi:hypothetical protein
MQKGTYLVFIILFIQGGMLQADSIITFPYPRDVASQIKDNFKKIDIEDAADEGLSLVNFKDLFDSAESSSIIIASVITSIKDKYVAHYYDALAFIQFLLMDWRHNPYKVLKGVGHKDFKDPVNRQKIERVYFFAVTRFGQIGNYSYKIKYLDDLGSIINDDKKIAYLESEVIKNNTTPDINELGEKKYETLYEQKIKQLHERVAAYRINNLGTIADFISKYTADFSHSNKLFNLANALQSVSRTT